MTETGPRSTAGIELGEVRASVSHRCSRMADHHLGLAKPCPECYSIMVVATRIPYEPDVPWHTVDPNER